jgi:tRNA threonylcarbamoyladenosine biosynthesis protein TsaB
VIILAIDTCEARGSVAVIRGTAVVAQKKHRENVDYSGWLLPAVEQVLGEARAKMDQVEVVGVATGPGSFTGLRVGLTTVKAWTEVYGKPIVGVSRLEAIAASQRNVVGLVAACYDGQRGQLFGGLYRSLDRRRTKVGEEVVVSPDGFVELVQQEAGDEKVTWVSLDPEMIENLETFRQRIAKCDVMHVCEPEIARMIGIVAQERAARGEFTDVLQLDANYVRRSDAEIFWKGPKTHVR